VFVITHMRFGAGDHPMRIEVDVMLNVNELLQTVTFQLPPSLVDPELGDKIAEVHRLMQDRLEQVVLDAVGEERRGGGTTSAEED
jgi:uncharacterized protein YecE (DUF72 family)